jgi:hypothetical protein
MRKVLISFVAVLLTLSSCKTVYSTTGIEAKKSFVLGDNAHESFEVRVKNISNNEVDLYKMPTNGTKDFIQIVAPGKSVSVIIEKNTALYIDNKSDNKVTVELNLKSSSHLSMGYKD